MIGYKFGINKVILEDGTHIRAQSLYRIIAGCLGRKGGREKQLPNGKTLYQIHKYVLNKGYPISLTLLRKVIDYHFIPFSGGSKMGFLTKIRRGKDVLFYFEFRYGKEKA